jgi:hypothetical protein
VDIAALKRAERGLARQCLDWTEREHHLAGPLGSAFLEAMREKGWLRRAARSRAIAVTPQGRVELRRRLDLDASPSACPAFPEQGPQN